MPPAAECPVCAAVANGGRVRVTRKSAALLVGLLVEKRGKLLVQRREAIESGAKALEMWVRGELRDLDRQLEEIERTMTERGWLSDGEPQ